MLNGTNTLTVANVETLVGGSGADTVVFSSAAAVNAVTVSGIETIHGGTASDRLRWWRPRPTALTIWATAMTV